MWILGRRPRHQAMATSVGGEAGAEQEWIVGALAEVYIDVVV
jgi:hypothetical protein